MKVRQMESERRRAHVEVLDFVGLAWAREHEARLWLKRPLEYCGLKRQTSISNLFGPASV